MLAVMLECDIGNSYCKWRLVDAGGVIVDRGCIAHAQDFNGLPALDSVRRVRVSSVAGEQIVQWFIAEVRSYGIEPEFAISTPSVAGITNAYGENAASLGVDRWLAVVAAYHRQQEPTLVIDAGSALTADLVAAGGQHLGGYIIPGTELMKGALFADTGNVRFEPKKHERGLAYGCSTADAVQAGILASQVGAVTIAIAEANRRISADFAILLTGGGAAQLIDYLPDDVIEVPELVLDGLCWLLP